MKRVSYLLPFLALFFAALMIYSVFSQKPTSTALTPSYSLLSAQLAAQPEGFVRPSGATPALDPRLLRISPLTVFRLPTATQFEAPLGTKNGALTYNAQPYWEHNPFRKGHHTGDDLNGIGGQNSDFGDPVYAVGDGLVVYNGTPSPGWGRVIIVAHRLPEGTIIQSLYAHLSATQVVLHQEVARGEQIAQVGSAGGQYFAHLHFEIREGRSLALGPGYLSQPRQHRSPAAFLAPYLQGEALFRPSLFEVNTSDWTDLEITNPEIFSRILSK